ncbi:ecotin family protein [Chryseobacterium sp. ERMR1:04]|uniref:ecotin family protein n=1 Tax=Chryseobacterium sp. ERMR1:04 TaxID=1705393 RepID=UPI0006C86220|nr:ecotin family protein [Chryseobacterium sp. ERMR1:04]KPH15341.1 ecotin [Chryseobacterium sp. ERMR1:04]
MNFLKTVITGLVLLVGVTAFAQNKTGKYEKLDIEMYPKAKPGYKQVYIQVPIEENESDLKVEFFVGIETLVDCNRHTLVGNVDSKNLEGWGYSYYEVTYDGKMMSTKMGCGKAAKTKEFVSFQPQITSYNSRSPLVFYVPKDMEVRYKVLRPDGSMKKAIQK